MHEGESPQASKRRLSDQREPRPKFVFTPPAMGEDDNTVDDWPWMQVTSSSTGLQVGAHDCQTPLWQQQQAVRALRHSCTRQAYLSQRARTVSTGCCSGAGLLHRGRLRDLPRGPPRTLCGRGQHRLPQPAAGAAHRQPAGTGACRQAFVVQGEAVLKDVACEQPPSRCPARAWRPCTCEAVFGVGASRGQALSALPLVHRAWEPRPCSLGPQVASRPWGSQVVYRLACRRRLAWQQPSLTSQPSRC